MAHLGTKPIKYFFGYVLDVSQHVINFINVFSLSTLGIVDSFYALMIEHTMILNCFDAKLEVQNHKILLGLFGKLIPIISAGVILPLSSISSQFFFISY